MSRMKPRTRASCLLMACTRCCTARGPFTRLNNKRALARYLAIFKESCPGEGAAHKHLFLFLASSPCRPCSLPPPVLLAPLCRTGVDDHAYTHKALHSYRVRVRVNPNPNPNRARHDLTHHDHTHSTTPYRQLATSQRPPHLSWRRQTRAGPKTARPGGGVQASQPWPSCSWRAWWPSSSSLRGTR